MKAYVIVCAHAPDLVLSKGKRTSVWLYREWDKIESGDYFNDSVEPVVFRTRKSAEKHLWSFNRLEEIIWE